MRIGKCILLMILFSLLTACAQPQTNNDRKEDIHYPEVENNPIVTLTMENEDEIVMELYPEIASNTVANFISLIERGFYDGLIFHRVLPGFIIQGGDPEGNGLGGPDYSIPGEFTDNNFKNSLSHERGIVSMARSQSPNSAGSQFFIVQETSTYLDGQYAAFGKVTEGMDVVDKIANIDRDNSDKPYEDQVIDHIIIETYGVDYPSPVKQ
ncbi:peptidylprolyl isomerase [Amphibacillus cookii]|uniref:peptidylprolyl isomerase n=1 Tax=Amphibacillus cookii TaxID=767787 RepID=UPI001957F8AE|nr:peptidylprolyl isomerase [Amphibacillus cookii]MBM7540774.1 peptidyl-prolyl cis-trans isomerase B (cyclophilin B) [Amphibacillus cookii]